MARQLGRGPALAAALSGTGIMQREAGAYDDALAALAESREQWQALGNREQAAYQLIRQGEVYQARAEMARARAAYEQSAAELGGHGYLTFRLHHHLGTLALEEGDLAAARLWICQYARDPKPAMGGHRLSTLADFAELAAAEGRPAQALRLAGALESAGTSMGAKLQPTEQQLLDRWMARARQALTPEEAAAAWQAGQDLTEAEALGEALAGSGEGTADAPTTQSVGG